GGRGAYAGRHPSEPAAEELGVGMQAAAIVVSLAITLVAVALAARAVAQIVSVIRLGGPAFERTNSPVARTVTMLRETVGHTRMLKWTWVGAAHWFVFAGFIILFATLVTAYGQVFSAEFALPVIGHWRPFSWVVEALAVGMLVSIAGLIVVRLVRHPSRVGRTSRFAGSTMWQGYYVEWTVVGVGACIVALRGMEYALGHGARADFPLTFWLGELLDGASGQGLARA